VTKICLELDEPCVFSVITEKQLQILYSPYINKKTALRGRQLSPISDVIICPAWETIAEQTLPRSLPLVAYLKLGHIRRLTDQEHAASFTGSFLVIAISPGLTSAWYARTMTPSEAAFTRVSA
jgi:hypothetical protein